jgi:3-oxoacyl-[acyl-carrier-protein] synthase-3
MTIRAKITGTGMYVPERVVPNAEILDLFECSEEWIIQRSGIEARRYVTDETPADLAERASRAALENAELEASDIDCIVLATLSPHAEFPGTSFFLQRQLELDDTPCFDLRAQCSGFLYSISVAKSFIESGQYRRILVVGCELQSRGLDMTPEGRDVAVLFGDGAGACVLEANEDANDPSAVLEVRLHAQGKFAEKLWTEAPGCALDPRISNELMAEKRHFPKMLGRMVFKHAVRRMPEVLLETLHAASLKQEDVDLFLFHQANLRINEYVAEAMQIPAEKVRNNVQRYGNCSAASLPILLAEARADGQLKPGDIVSLTAFGAGFSWASAVLRW